VLRLFYMTRNKDGLRPKPPSLLLLAGATSCPVGTSPAENRRTVFQGGWNQFFVSLGFTQSDPLILGGLRNAWRFFSWMP